MRWLPRSLFGRLMLVLAGGLLAAQLLSAALNLSERDRALLAAGGMQQAQRIADVVKLLDAMPQAERGRVAAVLSVPPLVLSLHERPLGGAEETAMMYAAMLRAFLGDGRAVRVHAGPSPVAGVPAGMPGHGPWMMGGPGRAGMHLAGLRTEVQLRDGTWARFDGDRPALTAAPPWRLGLTLALLAATVLALSYVAVRWLTRPLHALADAAAALGHDIRRPPLDERGPTEIAQAARAFNTMQARLVRFIDDRTRIFAAMSHDLKTPITRMRLRAEMLDDDAQRERFEADLAEMEGMVAHTLEFMRGLAGREAAQPVDIDALLDSVQADHEVMGHDVRIEGRSAAPLSAVPSLLRRCLVNLVDNAVRYGSRATIAVADRPEALVLRVRDEGPGIPDAELEKVFEPFYRLEGSRNRATGGTGLGLTIARNIAQSQGGDLVLRNRREGGLEAELTLPRQAATHASSSRNCTKPILSRPGT
jgi:signal transduction histidine kinase